MSESPNLVAPPKRRGSLIVTIVAAVIVIAIAVVAIVAGATANRSPASGTSGTSSTTGPITQGKGSPSDPVKIGVVGLSDPYWAVYKAAAAAAGISIDLVDFTDYAQPNPALTQGDLDLNQFQHIIYLAQYNKSSGQNLTPIGSTAIYPLALYSTKYKSVKDIPDGATVSIPNDASNLARGLLVLQTAGLVALKDGGSPFSTLADILPSSRVKVTTLEAALTPTSLPDVAAAIINNDFVADAGLSFTDALAADDPSSATAQPYINIFAARAKDKNNPVYQRLVELFQNTKSVTDGLVQTSGGTAVLVKTPVADLEKLLATVESQLKQ